ncbi:MAG: hypothetical protein AAGK78_01080, partial [Planctomycetota bacterium]
MNLEKLEQRRLLSGSTLTPGPGPQNLFTGIRVEIDADEPAQTVDGFGASINVFKSFEAYSDPEFFNDLVLDAGINAVRIPLYYSFENANDNDDPYVMEFGENGFDADAVRPMLEFVREMEKRADMTVLVTVWTPPSWMKTNGESWFGGYLRPEYREEFAEYISAFMHVAQNDFGVDIEAISLQNEPLFSEPYESAFVNPQAMARLMTVVDARLKRDGYDDVQLVAPEDLDIGGRYDVWEEELLSHPGTAEMDFIWGQHWGPDRGRWGDLADDTGRKVWWTEGAGKRSRGIDNGIDNSVEIADAFNNGRMSAFFDWQFDDSIYFDGSQSSLYVDNVKTARYAAMKHYAHWMQPGSFVLGSEARSFTADPADQGNITRDIYAVGSYNGDDDTNTVVLTNRTYEEQIITIDIVGSDLMAPDAGGDSGQNWSAYLTDDNTPENLTRAISVLVGGALPAGAGATVSQDGRTLEVRMPARSMITLYNGLGSPVEGVPADSARGRIDPKSGIGHARGNDFIQSIMAGNLQGTQNRMSEAAMLERWINGRDATHAAATTVRWDIMEVLDEVLAAANTYGIDIDRPDNDGMTPLMIAAASQQIIFNAPAFWSGLKIQRYLDAGADIHAKDNLGRTSLHWASMVQQWSFESGLPQLTFAVDTLLANGADPNKVDLDGLTALDWANAEGNSGAGAAITAFMNGGNYDTVGPQTLAANGDIYNATWTFDEQVVDGTLDATDFVLVHEDGTTHAITLSRTDLAAGNTQATIDTVV